MVDIGVAPGSSNVARIEVLPGHPQTMVIIGADTGAPDGPSRRVDVYEDVRVRGNLQVGELNCIRVRLQQGVDGVIHQGVDDEVPRIQKLPGDTRMHIIGGGPLFGPGRTIVLHDNSVVSHNLLVNNDTTVVGNFSVNTDATVGGELIVNGRGLSAFSGSLAVTGDVSAETVKAKNTIIAAATFHFYDRGTGVSGRIIDGSFGFNSGVWSTNTNSPWDDLGPVSMLILDETVMNPIVTITPWVVGLYDEDADGLPVLSALSTLFPNELVFPSITIKGEEPIGDAGTLPSEIGAVKQIEIRWANVAGSFAPITDTDDLVFDIKVMGATI